MENSIVKKIIMGLNPISICIFILILSSKPMIWSHNGYGFLVAGFGSVLTGYKYWKYDEAKLLSILEIPIIIGFILMYLKWREFGVNQVPNFSENEWF